MIRSEDFPTLVEFMRKCLFQEAAPTFEGAIRAWTINGDEAVRSVVREIDRLLSEHRSPSELDDFIDRNSDYGEEGGGHAALEYINRILKES